MLAPSDSDSKAFLIRAVLFGIVISWGVCFIVLMARMTNESVILAGIIMVQLVLSVITCNKYMYSIQPYVYTDVQLTRKVEKLQNEDPGRQIIHIFKGGIPYIEVVQFGLRDKTIDVIDLGDVKRSCSVPVFLSSLNALIVRRGETKVRIVAPFINKYSKFILLFSNIDI